jgi:hypothetical protein
MIGELDPRAEAVEHTQLEGVMWAIGVYSRFASSAWRCWSV